MTETVRRPINCSFAGFFWVRHAIVQDAWTPRFKRSQAEVPAGNRFGGIL